MIYIIKGEETHLIREKLKELSSNEEATVVKIDGAMPDFTVGKMLNACRQIDLFHSFSIVLVKDAPFLISKYDKKDILPFDYPLKEDPLLILIKIVSIKSSP